MSQPSDGGGKVVDGPATTASSSSSRDELLVTALSTSSLESKLRTLREQSNRHSQALTQRLATSQSGQNLLHIGSSLSTLPPDLHSLLTQLHPILSSAEARESLLVQQLHDTVAAANDIRLARRRVEHATECAALYQDLLAAERDVQREDNMALVVSLQQQQQREDNDGAAAPLDELDRALALERAAHTTLCLTQDLQRSTTSTTTTTSTAAAAAASSSTTSRSTTTTTTTAGGGGDTALPSLRTPLEPDRERAQFLMTLAPRIRRLETKVVSCLTNRLEVVLKQLQRRRSSDNQQGQSAVEQQEEMNNNSNNDDDEGMSSSAAQEMELLMIGHCMRGLALLGKGKEAESVFARVAIMPLIRSKVSMGRLDEGGSRGECAGLFSLLDDMACSIASNFGPVLRLSEAMFDSDIDLVTAGVWVPIATALMADPGIKMAIFSPGIASILQANYTALDTFLSELATRLLEGEDEAPSGSSSELEKLYFRPTITAETIQRAQERIYAHSMTTDFSKKWNLPIYYQLRFGECCSRLNKAIAATQREGWQHAQVFSGSADAAEAIRKESGMDLPLFLELYDILLWLWRPDVILRPLSHRFLRGALQMIGRVVAFVSDGLEGNIKFGEEKQPEEEKSVENGDHNEINGETPAYLARDPYCWGENVRDVAAVAWELTVLESRMNRDYVETVAKAIVAAENTESERVELKSIARDMLVESSQHIGPIVQKCWNEVIVDILTSKCCGPLAAVKGVAATYRMTNRPPPTQASPFVTTILRPLKEFDVEFKHRNPPSVGSRWKQMVVSTVSSRYSVAVEELLTTVQRTEEALKNRKARRTSAGGMSDGEKVKLQLYLDYQEFLRRVEEVGVNSAGIDGVVKLKGLTIEAEKLYQQTQNGKS